jgi:hypothetical protein
VPMGMEHNFPMAGAASSHDVDVCQISVMSFRCCCCGGGGGRGGGLSPPSCPSTVCPSAVRGEISCPPLGSSSSVPGAPGWRFDRRHEATVEVREPSSMRVGPGTVQGPARINRDSLVVVHGWPVPARYSAPNRCALSR